jgi:signal transduction histidine kinase
VNAPTAAAKSPLERRYRVPIDVLSQVIRTNDLPNRPRRTLDGKGSESAWASLAATVAKEPDVALDRIAETALSLCDAESAGVCVLEDGPTGELFRWHGLAGRFSQWRSLTIPRDDSPSEVAMSDGAGQLMVWPVRAFSSIAKFGDPIAELLLVPIAGAAGPVGTLWVVAHNAFRRFTADDLRIATTLANFASGAVQVLQARAAVAADKAKDVSLAIVAHEIRTPLNAVLLATQVLLRQGGVSAGVRDLVSRVASSARRLDGISRQLLDVSSIAAGPGYSVAVEDADLGAVCEEVVAELLSVHPRREVRVKLEGCLMTRMDRRGVGQVVSNLIFNAMKYGDDRTIGLYVKGTETEVVIAVHNFGLPIPPARQNVIFDAWTHGDRPRRPEDEDAPSLGLGLYIARGIVSAHGGSIVVHSSQALGTTFTVTLPRCSPETAVPTF